MHQHFQRLVSNKSEFYKKAEREDTIDNRVFKPKINQRSQHLASESLNNMKKVCEENGCSMPRHEELLHHKGRYLQEKRMRLIAEKEEEERAKCTFSPKTSNLSTARSTKENQSVSSATRRSNQSVFENLYREGLQRSLRKDRSE